jgi:hypothetical protein
LRGSGVSSRGSRSPRASASASPRHCAPPPCHRHAWAPEQAVAGGEMPGSAVAGCERQVSAVAGRGRLLPRVRAPALRPAATPSQCSAATPAAAVRVARPQGPRLQPPSSTSRRRPRRKAVGAATTPPRALRLHSSAVPAVSERGGGAREPRRWSALPRPGCDVAHHTASSRGEEREDRVRWVP